jgi:two-component system cell cycle response regulator DivK
MFEETRATTAVEASAADGNGQAAPAARLERAPIQPKDATVLVVEDNVSNFVLVARMLAYMGVPRCEWKTSGWQVVEYADILPRVDLILMDLRLPYEDGYTALAKIRSAPRLKDTIVVAVTAEANVGQLNRAREAGFDGFLGKPLDPDRFPDQIRRLLQGDPVWEAG